MGLLTEGEVLSWEETQARAKHVQEHGIQQFINLYRNLKDRQNDELKWGDEIEYIIVHFNEAQHRAQLALRAHDLLPKLQQREMEAEEKGEHDPDLPALWRPEMATYMVESSPGRPFRCNFEDFTKVESNMRARREEVQKLLMDGEAVLSVSAFPRIGCPDFTFPPALTEPMNPNSILRSLWFPDDAIFSGHSRMRTILGNLCKRRGRKPYANVPLFKDKNTVKKVEDDFAALGDNDGEVQAVAKAGHITMDSCGHGMGCCCLQVTFQAQNVEEARFLYDQLAIMCPFMMTLAAAAPMYQGYLSDVDCRWDVLAACTDDRTEEEMGLKPLKEGGRLIPKSRYGSVDHYLSPEGDQYNDVPAVINEEYFAKLVEGGIDAQLSKHIAKLFIREPLILYSERVHQDDEKESNHFENIQSTNWQSLRFKPPPVDADIGWRIEFRPMETQLTDFENAAFVIFVVLLTRTIVSLKLNFLLPMSMVEENMSNAQKRNAVGDGRFWFRQHILSGTDGAQQSDKIVQMTVNEVFNGKDTEEGHFEGLVPLVEHYLSSVDLDVHTKQTLQSYLQFISKKASGELLTTAGWMRKFVLEHPDYKQDSKVSETINYDLMKRCRDLSQGLAHDPTLLPDPTPPLSPNCQERMASGDLSRTTNGFK